VAIVAIMLVATFFNPSRLFASFPIDPGEISLSGTKIVMELPRVSGFTSSRHSDFDWLTLDQGGTPVTAL
jgi:hypothetical protein